MRRSRAFGMMALLAAAGALGQSPEPVRHIAYSLKVARHRIEQAGGNWRRTEPTVFNLAGVNKVEGLVFDASTSDLILVGEREAGRAVLTLDDLVVALRARFVHDQWPLVSIDPTTETRKTHMQHVRFEGGIEDTAFGKALFEADYRLKELALGLQDSGVMGLRSDWERRVEELQEKKGAPGQQSLSLRFWFCPISPQVTADEGVGVVSGLRVGVFTEVLAEESDGKIVQDVKGFKVHPNEAWATDVSQRFDELSATQPSVDRLRGLQGLVAASKTLQELEDRPDLSWWLEKYPVERIQTPIQVKVLRRRTTQARRRLELSGGVHLTAVAMRSRTREAGALREVVLRARPSENELNWEFVAREWRIPAEMRQMQPYEPALLLAQARFLARQSRHQAALMVLEQALTISPGLADGWKLKGALLASLYRHREALECFDRALELGPRESDSWRSKAQLLTRLGHNEDALIAVNLALGFNPSAVGAWQDKSMVLTRLGRVPETLECYRRILEINPHDAGVWRMRGLALATVGRYDEALISLAQALRINPRDGEAWYHQALYLAVLRRYVEAQEAMRKAAEVGHEVAREVLKAAK